MDYYYLVEMQNVNLFVRQQRRIIQFLFALIKVEKVYVLVAVSWVD